MSNELRRPQKCITVQDARELENNWVKTRAGVLEKSLGFQDAREYSWSVAELEEYLAYVKSESEKQGITNPGIRIYLGAYPENNDKFDKPFSTVFLAPTGIKDRSSGKDGTREENNYNIDPFNFGNQGHPPIIY